MVIDAATAARLERHLLERLDNRAWIERCSAGDVAAFPHRPYEEGTATMGRYLIKQHPPDVTEPVPSAHAKPRYVINVPMRHYPGSTSTAEYTRFLHLVKDEAFSTTEPRSRARVRKRVVTVIGVNQVDSIDPAQNRAFEEYIGTLPKVAGVTSRVIGFQWTPEWVRCRDLIERTCRGIDLLELKRVLAKEPAVRTATEKALVKKFEKCRPRLQRRLLTHFGVAWSPDLIGDRRIFGRLYDRTRALLVLKALSNPEHDLATPVRLAHEGGETGLRPAIVSQVPYQGIRQTIMHSQETKHVVQRFAEQSPESLGYLVLMDPDLTSLRSGEGKGILTHFDKAIAEGGEPSWVTLGYRVPQELPPLLRAGVEVDNAARIAMGYLAYPPEPCSAFLSRRPHSHHHLDKLSFYGDGDALESRRLIRSGLDAGVFQRDGVFKGGGGVMMESLGRGLTPNQRSVSILTPAALKRETSLKAIRDVRQQHATPLKFAEIMYGMFDYSTKCVAAARGPFSHIFAVFDPISRMFAYQGGKYSHVVFDQVMAHYDDPLTADQQAVLTAAKLALKTAEVSQGFRDKVKREHPDSEEIEDYEEYINGKIAERVDAVIAEVEEVARRTGKAIHAKLQSLAS